MVRYLSAVPFLIIFLKEMRNFITTLLRCMWLGLVGIDWMFIGGNILLAHCD